MITRGGARRRPRSVRAPRTCPAPRRSGRHERTYFTEALRDYLLNRSDILGDTYEERYTRLHRGGLRIHTTLDPILQAQAERAPQRAARQRRRASTPRSRRSTRQDRRDPGDGRRAGVRGRPERGQPGAGAEPDRVEHQVVHPVGGAPGRGQPRKTSSMARIRAVLPNVGNPDEPFFEIRGGGQRWYRHAPQPHRPLDQLCVRPHVADRRSQSDGRHGVPDGCEPVPLPRPAARANASRSSRSRRSRPAPTR